VSVYSFTPPFFLIGAEQFFQTKQYNERAALIMLAFAKDL
jgi:hypothetical protein